MKYLADLIDLTHFSDLRSSMSGQGVPEDVKSRVLSLHEDNVQLREQLKTVQDKLTKARVVWDSLYPAVPPFFSTYASSSNRRISFSKRNRPNWRGSLHL
jgi:hypothetical protein